MSVHIIETIGCQKIKCSEWHCRHTCRAKLDGIDGVGSKEVEPELSLSSPDGSNIQQNSDEFRNGCLVVFSEIMAHSLLTAFVHR